MANLNLLVFLNTYSDTNPSNAPSLQNFKWTRDVNGISANNPTSITVQVAANSTVTIFSGSAVKKLVYMEADQICSLTINGTPQGDIKPIIINTSVLPGLFFRNDDITSVAVTNTSLTTAANVFLASIE